MQGRPGIITTVAGGGSVTRFNGPVGLALDTAGTLYITDECTVLRMSAGVTTAVAGTGACGYHGDGGAATAAALYHPERVAHDASGAVYIADKLNCRCGAYRGM